MKKSKLFYGYFFQGEDAVLKFAEPFTCVSTGWYCSNTKGEVSQINNINDVPAINRALERISNVFEHEY
jgi:hypothetical protein